MWDCAQHADAWGRRLPELRSLAQQSEPANDAVVAMMTLVQSAEGPAQTIERVTSIYRVLKPHLATVYERHLAVANPVYEPPTRRILERCLGEEHRHAAAGQRVLERLIAGDPALAERARVWEARLLRALTTAGGITGDVEAPLVVAPAVEPDPELVTRDLVPPPPSFDPARALGDLAAPLHAHGRAFVAGDLTALRADVASGAPAEVAALYEALPGPCTRVTVVGCARIGAQRMVKLRLEGAHGAVLLHERWVPSDAGWRVAAVEATRVEPGA